MGLGAPPSRYAIVKGVDSLAIFVWTIYYAIYEDFCLKIPLQAVDEFYHGLLPVSFTPVNQYAFVLLGYSVVNTSILFLEPRSPWAEATRYVRASIASSARLTSRSLQGCDWPHQSPAVRCWPRRRHHHGSSG